MRRIWACRGAAGRWWRRRTWWTWGRPRWTCRCTSPHSPGSRWAWRHLGEGQFKKYLRNFKEIPRHLFGWYGVDLALVARILGNTTRWSSCHYNSTTPQRGLRALEGDSWIIFIFHPPWMKNKYLKNFYNKSCSSPVRGGWARWPGRWSRTCRWRACSWSRRWRRTLSQLNCTKSVHNVSKILHPIKYIKHMKPPKKNDS